MGLGPLLSGHQRESASTLISVCVYSESRKWPFVLLANTACGQEERKLAPCRVRPLPRCACNIFPERAESLKPTDRIGSFNCFAPSPTILTASRTNWSLTTSEILLSLLSPRDPFCVSSYLTFRCVGRPCLTEQHSVCPREPKD